jgi:hypothetical protein
MSTAEVAKRPIKAEMARGVDKKVFDEEMVVWMNLNL